MSDPDEDHENDEPLDPEIEEDAQLNDRAYNDWIDKTTEPI